MIPLIKIRLTYLKRHYWKCFFYYFSAGVLILIILLIYIIINKIYPSDLYDENFDTDIIHQYPSYHSIYSIAIISEDKNLFYEFKNHYTNIHYLKYYKNKNEIENYNSFDLLIEFIKINEKSYQFKVKSDRFTFKKSIEDEKSKLMIPYDDDFAFTDLSDYAFYIHNFLLSYNNKTAKDFKVYSYKMKKENNEFDNHDLYEIPIFISLIYGIFFLIFH